ncbi:MAG: tetratricopeptide repeat protein [Chitinophagales bacterium]|nr:tetratricopeptide repeat protein [Bacteroidota bacterium]MCB9043197.1 tetratricopeptide repeat protein [Chitinophagales bacterium]
MQLKISWLSVCFLFLLATWSCNNSNEENTTEQNSIDSQENAQNPLQDLNERIAQDSTNANLYFVRASKYAEMSDWENAGKDIYAAIQIDSTQENYYLLGADIFLQAAKSKAALQLLAYGEKNVANAQNILLEETKILLITKQYDEALAKCNQILGGNVQNPKVYFYKGLIEKEMGQNAHAIESFQRAVEYNPDYYDALMQLGLLFSENKNNLAIGYFDNAIRVDSSRNEAFYAKAMFYQNDRQYEKAKNTYREIIRQSPQNHNALYNIGYVLIQQDSIAKAANYFELATRMNPAYAEAYYMRGLCAEKMNDTATALNYYKQALNFNNELTPALEAIQRLKNE